jgi:hypothetical protein
MGGVEVYEEAWERWAFLVGGTVFTDIRRGRDRKLVIQ